MDSSTLNKIKTRYDASKIFSKGKKIFFYFSAKNKEDNTYKYYLFNPVFSFNKNEKLKEWMKEDKTIRNRIKSFSYVITDAIRDEKVLDITKIEK